MALAYSNPNASKTVDVIADPTSRTVLPGLLNSYEDKIGDLGILGIQDSKLKVEHLFNIPDDLAGSTLNVKQLVNGQPVLEKNFTVNGYHSMVFNAEAGDIITTEYSTDQLEGTIVEKIRYLIQPRDAKDCSC